MNCLNSTQPPSNVIQPRAFLFQTRSHTLYGGRSQPPIVLQFIYYVAHELWIVAPLQYNIIIIIVSVIWSKCKNAKFIDANCREQCVRSLYKARSMRYVTCTYGLFLFLARPNKTKNWLIHRLLKNNVSLLSSHWNTVRHSVEHNKFSSQ